MSEQARHDSLVRKLKALLATADENSGASDNERAQAAAAYVRLLQKHNIDEAELRAEKNETIEVGEEFFSEYHKEHWISDLITVVAISNFCRVIRGTTYVPKRRGSGYKLVWRFTLVGSEINRLSARLLFEYLKANLNRACKGSYHHESFKNGAVSVISQRLREVNNIGAAGLPAVVDEFRTLNQEFIDRVYGKLGKVKNPKQHFDQSSYTAGYNHGKTVNLSRQVGSPANREKIS